MPLRRWTRVIATVLLSSVFLLLSAGHLMALQVGDKAPDFSLAATTAEKVSLADYLGKRPVVVFFFIGAFTAT
jgi:AhpC/TSA family